MLVQSEGGDVTNGFSPSIQDSRGPLPTTLADVGRNLEEARAGTPIGVTHDVFLSHVHTQAEGDKHDVARPLHDLLVERGFTVWLDEVQMEVGASLRRGIDQAVATSRYAVVVLSPAFFAKNWTQCELDGLVAREMNGEQIILPIWHSITKGQLLGISPSLADRVALSTATMTLVEIADALAASCRGASWRSFARRSPRFAEAETRKRTVTNIPLYRPSIASAGSMHLIEGQKPHLRMLDTGSQRHAPAFAESRRRPSGDDRRGQLPEHPREPGRHRVLRPGPPSGHMVDGHRGWPHCATDPRPVIPLDGT